MTGCNVLIGPGFAGTHQAWCKVCGWFGAERDHAWQARLDKDAHVGADPVEAPPWARGPGR